MNDPKEQFSSIYDQYIEKIYRFIYLKVDTRETAEDISSKVFLKGWESYKEGKQIVNPGAFLYQIARNTIADHYRGKDRTKVTLTDYTDKIADPRANLYEKAAINSDIEMVKSAIQRIKKDYQDVIIWYYLEDMPTDQIAGILDKPAGAVRVMIHRGLKALKNELA